MQYMSSLPAGGWGRVVQSYIVPVPRWRRAEHPRSYSSWASPVFGISSWPRLGNTSPPRRWAGRCSSGLSPRAVWTSPCTRGTWTAGSRRRTSGRTCGRTRWSPARTSGRGRSDTPAAPWWAAYDTRTCVPRRRVVASFGVKAVTRLRCLLVGHGPFK